MKVIVSLFLFLSSYCVFAGSGDDCVDCGNNLTGTNNKTLVLINYTAEELIDKLACGKESFDTGFCHLITVFEKMDNFYKYVKKCHSDISLDELYGRAAFACQDGGYNRHKMGLLNHLAIRFGTFSTDINDVIRVYRDQGRLEDFSKLINQKDSQGRTFLDIHYEAVQRGEYFGTTIKGLGERPLKKMCMLGGRFEKYPHPEWCKRKDKLFK